MALQLTEEQKLAVENTGNILVAAAAGSGKTAVLVERVINKLCSKTNPVRADRLLIVTFTNAAAAEMKSRIEKRLDEECRNNPEDVGLLLQKHLLQSAKICTIDSFCIDFVRENFEKLGISPDFKLSDNVTLKPIDERVLAEVLAPYFEERNEDFDRLLDIVGAEYDEGNFSSLVLNLYDYSRQLPFPEKWFDSLAENYGGGEFKQDNPWRVFACEKALKTVMGLQKNVANAVDLLSQVPKMADKFLPMFMFTSEKLEALYESAKVNDWDGIYNNLKSLVFPPIPSVKGSNDISQIKEAKSIYEYIRGKGIEILYKLFYENEEYISNQFKMLYPKVKLLSEILKEYSRKLFETYVEENTVTFHNTEALALRLLCSEDNGVITINPEAEEFLKLFEEVCVDEYQDTNDLQNMLFYVLSNKDKKLFAVGDVKQSIYGFRGANPDYFIDKKNRYISAKLAKEGEPQKIILGSNFRSRPEVCDFINYFFSIFMTKETGKIIYGDEEKLIPKGEFPKLSKPAVSMDIIEKDGETENKVLEARQIAYFIDETMKSGKVIREDKDTLREAKYSDFTILLRSMKGNAEIIANELRRQGIPVNYSAEGFCGYTEIAVMLSLLKVIDNPENDVELLSVMMSPIFGFTADDMAKIRIHTPSGSLYSAVTLFAENGDGKTKEFLAQIQKFRLFSVTNTLPKLISILLENTGFLNIVMAYNDGERRRNNLLLLVQYAESFIASYKTGIGGFVDFITKQSESNKIKSASALSGENAVTIMSIHGSKGLQFPVCIVAFTSVEFNTDSEKKDYIYSTKYGIGFRYFDEEEKLKKNTIARQTILTRMHGEQLEEELRLFYVAMTRTQDILYFTGVLSNAEDKVQKIINQLACCEYKLTADYWNRTRSYLDWLLTALIFHPDGKVLRGNGTNIICNNTDSHINLRIIDGKNIPDNMSREKEIKVNIDSELLKNVKENLDYKYPFEELIGIQSKASVSVIANKAESEKYNFSSKPAFMSDGGITASGRGTAMHKVMEFFDFSKWETPETEIERLVEWQYLSETEANGVNISALRDFFNSDIFHRMQKSQNIQREMRFLTELPARIVDNSLSEKFDKEKIIVQGAVDVCFVEDDGIVILDFKTDRTDNPQGLAEAYGEQLNIYALACEKIFSKPVKEKMIYSFFLSKTVTI